MSFGDNLRTLIEERKNYAKRIGKTIEFGAVHFRQLCSKHKRT